MLSIPASTVTGTVSRVIRHGHTMYGNPTMSVELNVTAIDGTPAESSSPVTVRIQDNSGIVYGIENREYREEPHTYELSKAGRIRNVTRA